MDLSYLGMTWGDIILLSLGCGSLCRLFIRDDGPFDICLRFRRMIGIPDSDTEKASNFFGRLVACVNCLSVWVAFFLLLGVYFCLDIVMYVSALFAIRLLGTWSYHFYYFLERHPGD